MKRTVVLLAGTILVIAVAGCGVRSVSPSATSPRPRKQVGLAPPVIGGRGGSMIDELPAAAAREPTHTRSVASVGEARRSVSFKVLVPRDTKGRPVSAVYTRRRRNPDGSGLEARPGMVYIVYGDDIVVCAFDDPTSSSEALLAVHLKMDAVLSQIAVRTTVRGVPAVKWDKAGRPTKMESAKGADDGQAGFSVPFGEVLWWENGVTYYVASESARADELQAIADSMR